MVSSLSDILYYGNNTQHSTRKAIKGKRSFHRNDVHILRLADIVPYIKVDCE